jgi:hypothetical protein
VAKFVLKTPVVTVNSIDLSDHVRSATVETSRPEVDVTAFGAANQEVLAGIGTASITLEFFQDFAGGEVDATLWPLSSSDTPFVVAVKPTNGAISATNPEYQLTCLMFDYSPIAGAVGEASQTSVTFRNASQTGLVRDVTP